MQSRLEAEAAAVDRGGERQNRLLERLANAAVLLERSLNVGHGRGAERALLEHPTAPTVTAVGGGTSFQTPGKMENGSDTIRRSSSLAPETRVVGVQSADGVDVCRREQRAGGALGRVAHGPEASPSETPNVAWTAPVDPAPRARRLDQADRLLERPDRVVLEPERQREVEDDLGVGRALDLGE